MSDNVVPRIFNCFSDSTANHGGFSILPGAFFPSENLRRADHFQPPLPVFRGEAIRCTAERSFSRILSRNTTISPTKIASTSPFDECTENLHRNLKIKVTFTLDFTRSIETKCKLDTRRCFSSRRLLLRFFAKFKRPFISLSLAFLHRIIAAVSVSFSKRLRSQPFASYYS